MDWASQMARLKVARATGVLPDDLGDWLLAMLAGAASDSERRHERNQLLRRAGQNLVEGSLWARAGALADEIAAAPRRHPQARGTVLELVRAALAMDPRCPRTQRQLYTILAGDD